ncbi:MAG: hypothetical protein Q8N23_18475 [Archangium sp.]|nr:hypothetical protein [Archangium sp.]MDP3572701.1 hypothetical protein [Archangium sp.]
MKARHVGLGAALVVGLAGGALWLRASQEHAERSGPDATPAALAGAGATQVEACRFEPGALHAFNYRNETHFRLNTLLPGAAAAVAQPGEAELSGLLTFEVLSSHGTEAVLLGRLTQSNDKARLVAGQALENGFLARIDQRCQVVAYARHQQTPRLTSRVQHVMLSDLGFSVADGTPVAEASFPTSVGTLRAMISRGPEGELLRKPLNYLSRWSPRMEGVDVVDGLVEVRRAERAWFETLHGAEEVAGGAVEFSRTEWDVNATPAAAAPLAGVSRQLADYVWVNALAEVAEARVEVGGQQADHDRRVQAMAQVTWPVAIERFTALLETGANINEQWRDMAAFLDAHPEQVETYVEHIMDEDYPPGFKAPAFLALGQARTPVAREALLGIYRERQNAPADRIRGSLALVTRADVGKALAQELRSEATRTNADPAEAAVARQALLHLGILSGTRPHQADVVQESMAVVQQLAAAAKSPEDYSVLCGMVGNMAELALLPSIEQWTHLPDPQSRKSVPAALRRYKVERVYPLVTDWLARETSPDVKRELFDALFHMYVDAGRPVDEAIRRKALEHLQEQPMVLTRQSLLHILGPFAGSDPEVNAALRTQLKLELEERSGLYSLVAQYLPARSVYEVLATVPKLRTQFGGALQPTVESTPPRGREIPIPDMPQPPGFEAAMREAPRGEPGGAP